MERNHFKRIGTLLLFMTFFSPILLSAQSGLEKMPVTLNLKDAELTSVINTIQQQLGLRFIYNVEELKAQPKVSINVKRRPLEEVLNTVLQRSSLSYSIKKNVVVIVPKLSQPAAKDKRTVTGRITDVKGFPLPGVTIEELGSQRKAFTNIDGDYTFLVDEDAVLRFSFLGMESALFSTRGVPGAPLIHQVVLKEKVSALNEVVVTGYQNINKRLMVGAVASVKADDIRVAGVNSIDQLLQGRLPGVVVTNASGLIGPPPKVRVRGTSTLLSNQAPVWVVDGILQEEPIPFDYKQVNFLMGSDRQDDIRNMVGSAVSFLNADDIDEITVLKDAAATAIYGVKAANGVIVITTKKGRSGRTNVSYSSAYSVSARPSYTQLNLMNSKERIDVSKEIYERGLYFRGYAPDNVSYEGLLNQFLGKKITQEEFNAGVQQLETMNTDWYDLLFQTPFSQRHTISASGGNDKTTYYGSLGFADQKGTAIGNGNTSYNANLNVTSHIRPNLELGARLSGAYTKTTGFYRTDPYRYAYNTSRAIPAFNADGSPYFYKGLGAENGEGYSYNFQNEQLQTGNVNFNRSINAAVNLRYSFLTNFSFESVLGLGTSSTNGETWASERSNYITIKRMYEYGSVEPGGAAYLTSRLPNGGELNTMNMTNLNYTLRNSISYNKSLRRNRDHLSVLVGQEIRSNKYDGVSSTVYGYYPDRGKKVVLPPKTIKTVSGATVENGIYDLMTVNITDKLANYFSAYATAAYSFSESKYVLSGSLRTDASNRFGQDKRYRFNPTWSLGARWNMADENFVKDVSWLGQLSLRASYGFQGNVAENFGPELIAQLPEIPVLVPINEYMLQIKNLGYPDLRWEKTKSSNIGLDFSLFKGRASGSVEYYNKKTMDAIVYKELPHEYGLSSMPVNAGTVTNRGYELMLNFVPVSGKDFSWRVGFNTGKNFNKVESKLENTNTWVYAATGQIYRSGLPVSSFYSFQFTGLNPQTGQPTYGKLDPAENPKRKTDITEAMAYSGQLDPDFTGGLNTNLSYKAFSLSFFFNFQLGSSRRLPPLFDRMTNGLPYPFQNMSGELTGRWRKPGDEKSTTMPSLPDGGLKWFNTMPAGETESVYRMYDYSDIRVVSGDFLRCRNIALGYNFPGTKLKKIGVQHISVQGSVTNPFVWADKRLNGLDPEVLGNSLPLPKNFSLSLNAGF